MTVAVLHPGAMGASIAACLVASAAAEGRDDPVLWVGAGRSATTRERAEAAHLVEVADLAAAVGRADLVVSVCPPGAAEDLAGAVADLRFAGTYLDANAVAPATARRIGDRVHAAGATVVDGGIIGPPAHRAGTTRLYLSGSGADEVAARFTGSALETRIVDGPVGAASAVKMCFAAWTKGTSALLLAIRAAAEEEGVTDDLLGEWSTSLPDLVGRSAGAPAAVGPKAWRFEAEMHEIADTLASTGQPDGFHRAAAEVYRRLAPLRGRPHRADEGPSAATPPTMDEVLALLADASDADDR